MSAAAGLVGGTTVAVTSARSGSASPNTAEVISIGCAGAGAAVPAPSALPVGSAGGAAGPPTPASPFTSFISDSMSARLSSTDFKKSSSSAAEASAGAAACSAGGASTAASDCTLTASSSFKRSSIDIERLLVSSSEELLLSPRALAVGAGAAGPVSGAAPVSALFAAALARDDMVADTISIVGIGTYGAFWLAATGSNAAARRAAGEADEPPERISFIRLSIFSVLFSVIICSEDGRTAPSPVLPASGCAPPPNMLWLSAIKLTSQFLHTYF